MTLDEYNAKIAYCELVIKEAQADKIKIRKEFADSITAKYSEFVGKKVRIQYSSLLSFITEAIGFFDGFAAVDGIRYPVMQMFKIRKDGTKSRNKFSSCDLPRLDEPFTIKIVE